MHLLTFGPMAVTPSEISQCAEASILPADSSTIVTGLPADRPANAPRIHAAPQSRSRLGNNPLKALNRRTAHGRAVNDMAARLLANLADRDDPLVIADAISLAELRIKADMLRRDPQADSNQVIRI